MPDDKRKFARDDIVIRPVRPEDIPGLNAIRTSQWVVRSIRALPTETEAQTAKYFFEKGSKTAHPFVAVKKADGQPMGYVCICVSDCPRDWHKGELRMAVGQKFSGRGLGRLLVESAADFSLKFLGLKKLTLEVLIENERAVALYKATGFEAEGVLKQNYLVDGAYLDAYTMAKFL